MVVAAPTSRAPKIRYLRPREEPSMNQDDRQLIADLFDRMHTVEGLDKDRDAEALIHQSMRQNPDSPYLLVQSVLAQEVALQKAEARIRELEGQVGQRAPGAARASAGFAADEPALWEAPKAAAGRTSARAWGAPIGRASPSTSSAPRSSAVPAAGRGQGAGFQGQAPGQRGGGGFMAQAMTTAAGVAGGMLLASGISSLFSGGESGAKPSETASTDTSSADTANAGDMASADTASEQSTQGFADSLEQSDVQQASHDDEWGGGDDWGDGDDWGGDFDI
jgi:hypothetical protein